MMVSMLGANPADTTGLPSGSAIDLDFYAWPFKDNTEFVIPSRPGEASELNNLGENSGVVM